MRFVFCVLKFKIIKKNVLIGYIGYYYFVVNKVKKIMSMGYVYINIFFYGGLY